MLNNLIVCTVFLKCTWLWAWLLPHVWLCLCPGMVIQTLVFFICILFAVFLIIIPILYGTNLMLFHIISNMWWVACSPHFRWWAWLVSLPCDCRVSAKASPLKMFLTLTLSSEGPSGWCCSWLCWSSIWPPGFCSSRRTQEQEIWTTGANYT